MREIVFRGKRVKPVTLVSQWIYGNYVFKADNSLPGLSKHFIAVHDGFGVSQWIEVEPDKIGQYTGLKDKNGRRIFEGDIVKCKHFYDNFDKTFDCCKIRRAYGKAVDESNGECTYWRNYEVRMGDGRWVLRNGSDGHDMKQNYVQNHLVEVIGNIFDNPELLEEETHHV